MKKINEIIKKEGDFHKWTYTAKNGLEVECYIRRNTSQALHGYVVLTSDNKLYGLDSTNNNALIRNIVLHKYDRVPYLEKDGNICNSYGCPMVNKNFFERLEKILDNSNKTILLEIYY